MHFANFESISLSNPDLNSPWPLFPRSNGRMMSLARRHVNHSFIWTFSYVLKVHQINKNRGVHKMRLPLRHLLFICQFYIVTFNFILLSFWCQICIVLDFLLVNEKFRRHRSTGNDVFRRWKITGDGRTDGPTDGRTWPLIEMRSRI